MRRSETAHTHQPWRIHEITPDFRVEDECAQELANTTVHTVMHLGWVPADNGDHELRMAVLVKPNGLFGRLYMAAIAPLRYLVVYPTLTRRWERAWRDHRRPHRYVGHNAPANAASSA